MADYALSVSDEELQRYRLMAEWARADEAAYWRQAGIEPGAVVADIGCGPAAMSVLLAAEVAPTGRVFAIEPDDAARDVATRVIAEAGVPNVELRAGTGTNPGLPAGSVDVVVMRHVLAHNQPDEQRIVDAAAQLLSPGGSAYLVDIDGTAIRVLDLDPDLEDLNTKYLELHLRRGNDLQIGLRLAKLLTGAGLEVVLFRGDYQIRPAPPGLRPPAWAARDAMLQEGLACANDIDRWQEAFRRTDAASTRPTMFVTRFIAIGRKPATT
jgi:ubiquinone/menaquinone biosynthesis C-methylase UbiE